MRLNRIGRGIIICMPVRAGRLRRLVELTNDVQYPRLFL
jgi:hypothetical protein